MMRNIILKIAWRYCYLGEHIKNKTYWQKIYTNGMKLFCMILLTGDCYFRKWFCKIEPLPKDETLPIISLTSFPKRINSVWMVIDSIFNQTIKPKKILLVLTKEEFPDGRLSLPRSLKQYLGKGMEVVFTEYNLLPHNKYYYSLSTFREDDVITIDDDLYYWSDTIERLYKIKEKNPDCICANRVSQIEYIRSRLHYTPVQYSVGHMLMARGVCGVLYIPQFRPKELFDKEMIMSMSLKTDDNWLKIHEMIADIKVASGDVYPHPLMLLSSQKTALHFDNSKKERIIHDRLLQAYGLKANYNERYCYK